MIRFTAVSISESQNIARFDLADVLGDTLTIEAVLGELRQGMCEMWEVIRDKDSLAYMITRVERCATTEHETLVIVALKGVEVQEYAPAIINHAKQLGLGSIRFHTRRPALGRYLQKYGFQPMEHVFHKRLNHGQINQSERDNANDQQHSVGSGRR